MAEFIYTSNQIFPKEIKTERLVLKKVDFNSLSVHNAFSHYSDVSEHALKYVFWDEHETLQETKEWMNAAIKDFESGEQANYFIFPKSGSNLDDIASDNSDDVIGTASFDPCWSGDYALSGIFLFTDYWGYGVSAERGEAMLELTFEECDLEFYLGRCSVENQNSQKAIEKYMLPKGGHREGILPYERGEHQRVYYKLHRDDYYQNK